MLPLVIVAVVAYISGGLTALVLVAQKFTFRRR
jgi:hypothetical protein